MGIIIFGTGVIFERYMNEIDFSKIICFIDNDEKKQEKNYLIKKLFQ